MPAANFLEYALEIEDVLSRGSPDPREQRHPTLKTGIWRSLASKQPIKDVRRPDA
jgi:hypothetical protein